ncbi:YibE/F family protein [Companilactobacillus ginsenosidimutans]|uniref:Membrane protein n=1 Tax=Companilactobacillus ginsenosidimutans TaxID=1007676 RepID=A0A0H4QLD7_9LACO|nr:YibE/F family protein [Companilactobacillus ginsenosidimutans]AKP67891.1 membrane protein [Companilactobacillus ginsenosidimutans]
MWKTRRFQILIAVILVFVATAATYFDAPLYKKPIVQIEQVTQKSKTKNTDEYKNTDYQIDQIVKGHFANGSQKGKSVKITNSYTQSQLTDEKYKVGQQVFVAKTSKNVYSIQSTKRDAVLVFAIGLVVILLFCMKFTRAKLFSSVAINIVIFYGFMQFLIKSKDSLLVVLTIITAILIAAVALIIILGPTQDALMAFLSTLMATTAALLLSVFLLNLSNNSNIHFEMTEYDLQPYFAVFISQVIFSVLGVILDETMDISSSLIEMKQEVPDVKQTALFKAGMSIGRELVGPLINILLFIVFAENLNLVMLYLTNGNSVGYTLDMTLSLGVTQLIISAIGIVLTVPTTSFIASHMVARRAN